MTAISVLLKATIILAAAGTVHAMFFRRMSSGTRHLLWTLVVIAFLLLPVFWLVLPSWTIFVDTPATTPVRPTDTKEFRDAPAPLGGLTPGMIPPPAPVKQSIPNAMLKTMDWSKAATLIYAAVFILLAIRFAVDRIRMRRLIGNATEVTATEWLRLARDCAAHMGIRRQVRILRDSENKMPMAVGIVHGAVILPADSDTWSEERRRAVLLHEFAHIARFDCLTQSMAALACTLYWIHPGIWWVSRRLRSEREFACDDRVLGSGTNARDYGEHLLELAHGLKAGGFPAAVSMTGSGRLEKRLLALLDTARSRRIPRVGSYVAGVTILIAILVPLALVTISARTGGGKSSVVRPAPLLKPMSYSIPDADTPGTWEVHPADRPGAVQVQFQEGHSSHGTTIELSTIVASVIGLPTGFPNGDGPLNFSLPVEAGTFNADGVMRSGVGAGTYTFTPNPQFAEALAKRGYERPSAGEQRLLGETNIGLRFLDELAAEGYARPSHLTDLLRAASHGVSLNYIRSMANTGNRLGTIDALIEMRASGITPEFIHELSSAGLPKLSADDLRRVRASGIDAQYVLDFRALGYSKFSLDGLFELRRHGVDPEYVRGLAGAGYDGLSLDGLVELRNHGIDPEYIRGLQNLGYDKLPLDRLIELRGHGVDPEYARDLGTLGYPKLSLDTLIQLRGHGVDPEYIRSLKDLGYTTVPLDDFVRMRGHGVDADQIRRANARAGKRLSVDELIEMASHGWK